MGRFSKLEVRRRAEDVSRVNPAQIESGAGYPTGPAAEEPSDLDAAGWLRKGDEALFRGERKSALRFYSRSMDKDSRLLPAWMMMIRTLLLKGDISEATTWVNRGLALFPDSPPFLAMRAVTYARRGLVHQAINNSDAVLEKASTEVLAHIARGEVLLLADNKNFEYCFEQALKLAPPEDWKTPLVIGLILQERRLWAKAIQYYAKAAERNERSPGLWYHVGQCRAELGQGALARKAYQQALDLCPPDDPLILKLEHGATGSLWKRLTHIFRK